MQIVTETCNESGIFCNESGNGPTDTLRERGAKIWANFIAAGALGAAIADIAIGPCTRYIKAHMLLRAERMRPILVQGGVPALHALLVVQAAEVATFLDGSPGRHREARSLGGALADQCRLHNDAWYDLFMPFFKEIALVHVVDGRFGHAALVAAAEAGSADARALLLLRAGQPAAPFGAAGLGLPAPVPAWAPPPPPLYTAPLPAPAVGALAPPPKAPARPARAKNPPNLFAAGSGAMVGPALKTYADPPAGKACKCAAGAAVPHWHFECPLALAALFGHPCPGFDAAGALLPGDWSGADLSAAARTNWRTLVARHGLAGPRMSNGRIPNF